MTVKGVKLKSESFFSISHGILEFWRKNLRGRIPIGLRVLPHTMDPNVSRLFEYPFHAVGIDFVGGLPTNTNGNKWILTVICPYSNFLRTIPVPNKKATTAARALFNELFLQYGSPTQLQSDCRGEWLNSVLSHVTKLTSMNHIFTISYIDLVSMVRLKKYIIS